MKVTPAQLKDGLKILLKKKDLGYEEVAGRVGVSLPTFKRWMGAEEIKLGRLLEVCAILETSLGELEALSTTEAKRQKASLTMEQEKFFAENMHYFTYLSALLSGDSPEKIARENELTPKSTELYLLRLEKIGLLHRDGKGRVKLAFNDSPGWSPRGPLIRAQYRHIIESSGEFFKRRTSRMIDGTRGEKEKLGLTYMAYKVRREVHDEWAKRLGDLVRDFQAESSLEQLLPEGDDQITVVMSIMQATVEQDDPESKTFATTFGKLVNL